MSKYIYFNRYWNKLLRVVLYQKNCFNAKQIDCGGWKLILCNNNNSGWTGSNAILRNESVPTINGQFCIIVYANYLKKNTSGFNYIIDATRRGR